MLAKSLNFFYDSHFHYANCLENQCFDVFDNWKGCSCAHSLEEWNIQKENKNLIQSFGIHPQLVCDNEELLKSYLEFENQLLENKEISVIGETGFDLFTDEYNKFAEKQEEYFVKQIELADFYQVPVVIHCRKANDKLFKYSSKLKKLPSVLFHSFMGNSIDAQHLLNKEINGFFSFGKQIMNNNKKAIDCVKNLPIENLLLETDAPYQFLKGETKTYVSEIQKVYDEAAKIRGVELEDLCEKMEINFRKMFIE